MSWICDEAGGLVNLDFIEKLEVIEGPEEEDQPDYVLLAYFTPGGDEITTWITSGSEAHCRHVLEIIAGKLHMVNTSG